MLCTKTKKNSGDPRYVTSPNELKEGRSRVSRQERRREDREEERRKNEEEHQEQGVGTGEKHIASKES